MRSPVGPALVVALPGGFVAATAATTTALVVDSQVIAEDAFDDEEFWSPEAFDAGLDGISEPPVYAYAEGDVRRSRVVTSYSFGDTPALAAERGTIAGAYAAYDDVADLPERLVVEVREVDGKTVAGTDDIDTQWVEAGNEGELSGEEVVVLLMETTNVEARDCRATRLTTHLFRGRERSASHAG